MQILRVRTIDPNLIPMRLTCLLLMGLILLFAGCRSIRQHRLLKQPAYDTLEKYSYLLLSFGGSNDINRTNGTGFFYRDKGKLFLVTAYHVLTGCPIYEDTDRVVLDSLEVWYEDRSGERKCRRLSLATYRDQPCQKAYDTCDVARLDVSDKFKDADIHSVEGMVCAPYVNLVPLEPGDTVVCYGFSNVHPHKHYDAKALPRRPEGYIRLGMYTPRSERCTRLPNLYYYIHPKIRKGASGSPVFKAVTSCSGQLKICLIGIQSGSSDSLNRSTISRQDRMLDLFDQLK